MSDRRVPFLDLRISDPDERRRLLDAVERVFVHGRLLMGPEVMELEQKFAHRCGRKYGIGVSSGTDALYFALRSLDIGPGDEVITTSLSWIATANAIALTGAKPVFADVRDDLNLDPDSVRRLVTHRTRALLPVHYTGKICPMETLLEMAEGHDLHVVEDASQAFGARLGNRSAGSFGVIACFSMNPMKTLAACGEAGMIVTDSPQIAERLASLRYNGTVNKEECVEPSLNGRIDTLQAAILLERLSCVDEITERRAEIAAMYDQELRDIVDTPKVGPEEQDAHYTYTIQADNRDALKIHLEAKGIETKIQHPYLMPQQAPYLGCPKETKNAKRVLSRVLCIPANEKLDRSDIEYVASSIREFYKA